MKRKLNLNPHELYEMRKQGMTNKQIADSLDVCVATVHKYLKGYAKEKIKLEDGVSKLPPAEKLPEVLELRKVVAINGFSFDILPQEGKVKIFKNDTEFTDLWYSVDQIDDLFSALKAVRHQFK